MKEKLGGEQRAVGGAGRVSAAIPIMVMVASVWLEANAAVFSACSCAAFF